MLISVSRDWETVKNVFTGKPDQTGRDEKAAKQSKMLNNSAYSRLGNDLNSLHTSVVGLIIFANILDPDQARQNVWPDMNPNCLTI